MSQDEMSDDEKLAAEWANSLAEDMPDFDENQDGDDALKADDDFGLSEDISSEENDLASEWAAALADDEQRAVNNTRQRITDVQIPELSDFTESAKRTAQGDQKRELDFILDIPLDISAELGRTRLLIKDLLQLGQGSVVELNKLAGEPLEVFVNGKLVARGEAVVVNEKFGVRLTDIISPIERITQIS